MPNSAPSRALPSSGRRRFTRPLRLLATLATAVAVLGLGLVVAPPAQAGPAAPAGRVATAITPVATAKPAVPSSAKSHPRLKYGQRGSAVKYIQQRLGVRPQTGYFGPITRAAVKAYERRIGVKADGIVDKKVWQALGVKYVKPKAPSTSSKGTRILAEAKKHQGKPYRWGAAGPNAFDCSGFVGYVVKKSTGKTLPRTSAAIRAAVPRISKSSVRPGDLVFVHNSGGRVTHVAIYAGGGKWWESSRPGRPVGLNKAWTSKVSYGRVT